MLIEQITIGSDIEVFLKNKNTNEFVSAEGIIKGTKDNPYNFDKNNKYHCTSLDNVSAEFNTTPAKTPSEFYKSVQTCIDYINTIIPNDLEIAATPAVRFNEKWLQTKNAKTFGCDPSFNAWTGEENLAPDNRTNLRSAGLHIHIGYKNPQEWINQFLIKSCDLFLGVASIIIEPDNERKTQYGTSGAYRSKEYGVEYRTLSSYFCSSKELLEWCFNNTKEAIKFTNTGGIMQLGEEYERLIQNCINNNDKKTAEKLINEFKIKLP